MARKISQFAIKVVFKSLEETFEIQENACKVIKDDKNLKYTLYLQRRMP